MVVSLVFKHYEPFLRRAPVNRNRDNNGSGVDLLGDFEVVEFPRGFQFAHADERDVHQGDRFFLATECAAGGEVGLPSALDGFRAFAEGDLVDFGEERRMAAVVRPISV